MNLIYDPSISQPFIPPRADCVEFIVPGCIPEFKFHATLHEVKKLQQWRHLARTKRGAGVESIFESNIDQRYLLSEIIRCGMKPEIFGRCYERAKQVTREGILVALTWHLQENPSSGVWLDPYIAAAHQASNRRYAHRLLEDFE